MPDWQPITPSYPRPKGATPMRISLVPAYNACTSPNRTHGPPLVVRLVQPAPARLLLPDGRHARTRTRRRAASTGSLRATVIAGNPGTQTDEADVLLDLDLTDVRIATDLTDYTGELSAQFVAAHAPTRKASPSTRHRARCSTARSPSTPPARPPPAPRAPPAPPRPAPTRCVPGTVKEGRRAIWELGQARVFDGGADGDTATNDNTLFAVGGVFVP